MIITSIIVFIKHNCDQYFFIFIEFQLHLNHNMLYFYPPSIDVTLCHNDADRWLMVKNPYPKKTSLTKKHI
jgi:hypothetical protein